MNDRICSGKVTLAWKTNSLLYLKVFLIQKKIPEPHIWALGTFIPRKLVTSSSEAADSVYTSFCDNVKKQAVSHIFLWDLDDTALHSSHFANSTKNKLLENRIIQVQCPIRTEMWTALHILRVTAVISITVHHTHTVKGLQALRKVDILTAGNI